MTDTRFSSAIHTLILIAGAASPMTSEQIAESVGTNASYIRKLTALLKKGGVLASRRGVGGFSLCIPPEELTLYTVYRAIHATEHIHVFDLHQNPNDKCLVGKHIRPVLTEAFREIEEKAGTELKAQTLADLMDRMRAEIGKRAEG